MRLTLQKIGTSLVTGIFARFRKALFKSADKHITSKTSTSVSSVPLITTEIRREIRRRNKTHAKAKKIKWQ